MENDIALVASGYLLVRIGVLVAIGYLIYRVLRPASSRVRVRSRPDSRVSRRSSYARERYEVTRFQR